MARSKKEKVNVDDTYETPQSKSRKILAAEKREAKESKSKPVEKWVETVGGKKILKMRSARGAVYSRLIERKKKMSGAEVFAQ